MQFEEVIQRGLKQAEVPLHVAPGERALYLGLQGSSKSLLAWQILRASKAQKLLIVTHDLLEAEHYATDLEQWLPSDAVHVYQSPETVAQDMAIASPEALASRLEALAWLSNPGARGILLVPYFALKMPLTPVDVWQAAQIEVQQGEELSAPALAERLIGMGYERVAMTVKPGEMSWRGDIVDVYPLTAPAPLRFSLAFDEVERISYYDANSQKSQEDLDHCHLSPAQEFLVTPEQKQKRAPLLRELAQKYAEDEELAAVLAGEAAAWSAGESTAYTPYFMEYAYDKPASLFSYLDAADRLIIDDYPRLLALDEEIQEDWSAYLLTRPVPKEVNPYLPMLDRLNDNTLGQYYFGILQKGYGHFKLDVLHQFQSRPMSQFYGQMEALALEIHAWLKRERQIFIYVAEDETRQGLIADLRKQGVLAVAADKEQVQPNVVNIFLGGLSFGSELLGEKLVFIAEQNIFQRAKKKRRPQRQQLSNAERIKSYQQLEPGDYVVHLNHGIGRFTGVETIEVGNTHQDYLTIVYADQAKIHVPIDQIDLIQKYVSSEGKAPKLNKMGGTEWARTKQRVSGKIEDIADDLLEIYAERETHEGYAFGPDQPEQAEFEAAFPYTETEDQLRSIQEIKHDMEEKRPMDRLLVGDVGFGKTEVAMRAAFKALTEGKQVAFLVPTTVLANQHYETLLERFEGWPFEIGLLSRFRTKAQQDKTIKGLRSGAVQMVVGTHRLLSKDIKFLDLGLLVVDEEQRFGVKAKERLKQLKANIDILTLTATPIPRTLHLSILGARDLSIIETPPANRFPVQTYVLELNPATIRDALRRELARDGQAFYLFNNVQKIQAKATAIQGLVPEARIAIAHGQMTSTQLEQVMMDFVMGTYDVLVTTTIIETGVDIPNVNTLLVEQADHMGLSTLYQLRGRVGRSSRIAYAYFMYQPDRVLSEAGEKRLAALGDFTELGSGFKVAMSDLAIRGAGNLLGKEQHGFVNSVGFDLYSQMLEEAVRKKQGEAPEEEVEPAEIHLGLDAYLPSTYIPDERQKLEIYKRINHLEDTDAMWDLDEELMDRFGEPPKEVQWLLVIGTIKTYAQELQLRRIQKVRQEIQLVFSASHVQKTLTPAIFKALGDLPFQVRMRSNSQAQLELILGTGELSVDAWLDGLQQFLARLRQDKNLTSKT